MTRTKPQSLFRDDVCEHLREEILSCAIPPGGEIHARELAKKFGVSLSPVRDALHRLEAEGLVEVRPRQGYYVCDLSLEDALELYEIRIVLETACLERTVRAASDADLVMMDRHSHGPASGSGRQWIRHNREFHLCLASLCGNNRLISMTQEVILAFDRLTLASISQPYGVNGNGSSVLEAMDNEHGEMVAALKERNATLATALLRTHIERSRKRFLESYKRPPVAPGAAARAKPRQQGAAEKASPAIGA